MLPSDDEVDVLCDWIAARQRQNRVLIAIWGASAAVSGLLSLTNDRFVMLPLVPLLIAAVWLAAAWAADRWWRIRSRRAGHPVVRAEAPWSMAARRPTPPGWYDAPVAGTVHRTATAWVWRPSSLVAADLPTRMWQARDVAASTLTPFWGPALPSRAQLRLYLRGGETVELIVHEPSRLLAPEWSGPALNARPT